jgi:lysophospholipase L1-like esterase
MRTLTTLVTVLLVSGSCLALEYMTIDSMDDASTWKRKPPNQMTIKTDENPKEGTGAMHVNCMKGYLNGLAFKTFKAPKSWNGYDGISFWIKGDGSDNFGVVRIQCGSYHKGYLGTFPLKNKTWSEVRIAWADLVSARMIDLNSADGYRASDIDFIGFGKSWTFTTKHEKPALSLSVDDLRLVKGIAPQRGRVPIQKFPTLTGAVQKMKEGKEVKILALGDSITWGSAGAGDPGPYPAKIEKMLREHYRNEKIVVINKAIGGSSTTKGRQWAVRDISGVRADLVTIMFGYNEMPPKNDPEGGTKLYVRRLVRYLEEVAALMGTPPSCVILSPIPGKDRNWDSLDPYARGIRAFVKQHPNLTLSDVNAHFKGVGKLEYAKLMADEAHPNERGQEEMAKVVFRAITGEKVRTP